MLAGFSSPDAGPTTEDLPADMIAGAYVFIGDHSFSNSEKWNLQLGIEGSSLGYVHQAEGFGVVTRDS